MSKLISYRNRTCHHITIVFDGWKSGAHRQEEEIRGGVRILYSRLGDKADAVIKKMVSDGSREWIVVSSDRDIADHAWASGSVPVASGLFLERLEQTDNDAGDQDIGGYPERRADRGNPRRLSKREKAIRRVLSRL